MLPEYSEELKARFGSSLDLVYDVELVYSKNHTHLYLVRTDNQLSLVRIFHVYSVNLTVDQEINSTEPSNLGICAELIRTALRVTK